MTALYFAARSRLSNMRSPLGTLRRPLHRDPIQPLPVQPCSVSYSTAAYAAASAGIRDPARHRPPRLPAHAQHTPPGPAPAPRLLHQQQPRPGL